MATTENVIELLKQRLAEIEQGSSAKKSAISAAKKEAIAAADKAKKEAYNIADKAKKEAYNVADKAKKEAEKLAIKIEDEANGVFANEDKEKEKINKALEALGERVPFPKKTAKAETNNQKVYFALKELGSGTTADLLTKVNSLGTNSDGAAFDAKAISNAVTSLKKGKVVVADGKVGKALKYKIV